MNAETKELIQKTIKSLKELIPEGKSKQPPTLLEALKMTNLFLRALKGSEDNMRSVSAEIKEMKR